MRQPSTSGYHNPEDIDFGDQDATLWTCLAQNFPSSSCHMEKGPQFLKITQALMYRLPQRKEKEEGSTVNGAASYCTLQDLNLAATTVVKKTPMSFSYVSVSIAPKHKTMHWSL